MRLEKKWDLFLLSQEKQVNRMIKEHKVPHYKRFLDRAQLINLSNQGEGAYAFTFSYNGQTVKFSNKGQVWIQSSQLFVEYGSIINKISSFLLGFVASFPDSYNQETLETLAYDAVAKRNVRLRKLKELKPLFGEVSCSLPQEKWDKSVILAIENNYPLGPVYYMDLFAGEQEEWRRNVVLFKGMEKLETIFSYLESGEAKDAEKVWEYELTVYEFHEPLNEIQRKLVIELTEK